jgi:hypothetical protein
MQQISAAAVIDRVEKALQPRTGNAPKVQANRR